MLLIHGYRPQIVALDINFWIQFAFILFLPYFRFWSVLPNLQVSSGQISKALRATQRQLFGAIKNWLLALHCSLRLKAKRGTFAVPIGETQRIRSSNQKFSRIFFCCASPSGGVRIAAPIVLAQYKGNERIGEAWTHFRRASPIVIEITFLFRCSDRKRNYVQYKAMAN